MFLQFATEHIELTAATFVLLIGLQLFAVVGNLYHPGRHAEAVTLLALCIAQPLVAIALGVAVDRKEPLSVVAPLAIVLAVVMGAALCMWVAFGVNALIRRFAGDDKESSGPEH